jgi:hypothetical protein
MRYIFFSLVFVIRALALFYPASKLWCPKAVAFLFSEGLNLPFIFCADQIYCVRNKNTIDVASGDSVKLDNTGFCTIIIQRRLVVFYKSPFGFIIKRILLQQPAEV